jgi:tetratricopeptide (TPR) repeat protein
VSARTRVWLAVAAAAAGAVALTVGAVVLTRDGPVSASTKPPPLFLDLGVRTDREAQDLRRASRLYADGDLAAAARLFSQHDSLEARVGAAFASWPKTLGRLRGLPGARAVVRLHLGIALAALNDEEEARAELRTAARVEPDTSYAIRADDFLHPRFAPGMPLFTTSKPFPTRLAQLAPPQQFAAIEREGTADGADADALLRYGAALQQLGRPVSARRAFDAAALARPDAETLAAAAVGRFDKDRPADAFGRLGPLTRRFPRAQTVRFHLGVLLLWIGDLENARKQLTLAHDRSPESRLGREAKRFLDRL